MSTSNNNQSGQSKENESERRSEGGKKPAETRGHESLSEAGRKGGEASHKGSGGSSGSSSSGSQGSSSSQGGFSSQGGSSSQGSSGRSSSSGKGEEK